MNVLLLLLVFVLLDDGPTSSSLVIPGSSVPPPPVWRPAANAPSVPPSSVDGHTMFTDFGPVVPQLSTAYKIAAPIAKYATTPLIHAANAAIGGASPYADLKPNGDGTYTDGLGAHVTPNADGTVHRTNPSFSQTNGGKVIIATGHAFVAGAKKIGGLAESGIHAIASLF